jgi:NAD-dependent SIR2 family protein deacetylase
MQELRCTKCNKKLAEYEGNVKLSIKCPRCGVLNIKQENILGGYQPNPIPEGIKICPPKIGINGGN